MTLSASAEVERPRSLSRITNGTVSESEAEYWDASENVVYSDSLDLLDTIKETTITMNLFLNNKFELAEERMAQMADRSIYHALGHNCIVFIKAMMTCLKKDMEYSMTVCKNSLAVIDRFRQKLSISETLFSIGGKSKPMTDEQLHAELLYAETLMVRAILSFFQDENLAAFIRGGLQIRTCYRTFRYCERLMNDDSVWVGRDPRVRDQFESGVRLGLGGFNLMISTLPSKVLRLLEFVGFTGDKIAGMNDLNRCASMTDTLHAPMCSLFLLTWHLVVCFVLGTGKPDLGACHRLLPPMIQKYPKGAIVLFLRARLLLVCADVEKAIHFFNKSVESQDIYKQFHHGCYWELMFSHTYLRQWDKAANYAKKLVNESKWSRCIYNYLLCIYINADESTKPERREETVRVIAKKVDGLRLRIAGKSIPVEKFCSRKINRYLQTGSLMLAHYEFLYFWNGLDVVNEKTMKPILADIENVYRQHEERRRVDTDDRCLYLFLKAVCLRSLHYITEAEDCLTEVIQNEGKLTHFTYLPPNATYEMALLRIAEGRREEAEQYLSKARSYKGYSLENKLHFRIHSAMDNMGARTPMV